jgi:hypothetical protein
MGRLPRNRRVSSPPSMRLTERDVAILRAVHDFRVLRGDQLQALFFNSQSTASYRLSRLYQHGFVERHFLPTLGGLASSPTLYTLGKWGVDVLRQVLDCGPGGLRRRLGSKELSPMFLEHMLAINDMRVAVTVAARQNGYTLETWLDDAHLKAAYDRVRITTTSGRKRDASLIPDGYFAIRVSQGRACFFLEVDRGTMTVGRFQDKIRSYMAYIASGQYERRYGTRSLRVLTITSGPNRLANLKDATERTGGGRTFWFAILQEISKDSVLDGPVWQVAGDSLRWQLVKSVNEDE